MRITVFVVTAIVEFAAAVFGLFVLLLGLNGFSERQATPGSIFYILFCLVSSLIVSFLGTIAAKTIIDKQWLGKAMGAFVSIVLTSTIGVMFVVVAVFAGFILAEFLREQGKGAFVRSSRRLRIPNASAQPGSRRPLVQNCCHTTCLVADWRLAISSFHNLVTDKHS